VAGRRVVGVAALVGLLAVGELEGHLALDHVAPGLALAAIVGQLAEERGQVGVLRVGLEADLVSEL
jgi:hypothetical protein